MLRDHISRYWLNIQGVLFPFLKEELGELSETLQKLVCILELIRIEAFIPRQYWKEGRPAKDRAAIARAFIAKIVFKLPTTRALLDRLEVDIKLRRICGFETKEEIPSESTFSRAFEEFSKTQLPEKVHEALVKKSYENQLVGHLSIDSTSIEAREKPKKKEKSKKTKAKKRKKGRPKKEEEEKPDLSRLEKQPSMTIKEMRDDLPKGCDVGTKKNSKGYKITWNGYKLHLDVADGDIPISAILTSASLHDSQVAIPLMAMSSERVTSLYDVMDSAYDSKAISDYSQTLGHVSLIDCNPRRDRKLAEEICLEASRKKLLNIQYPEEIRYNERSSVERVNGNLKDNFGGRMIGVRGQAKVFCHLMFGVLALTADQIIRFAGG
jgi:transposase